VDPEKLNSEEVSRYWLDEAEEALTILDHLFEKAIIHMLFSSVISLLKNC